MSVSVYKAPAGAGKTHKFAQRIADTKKTGRIEVYVPTLALAREWQDKVMSFNPNRRVNIIAGRDQLGANQQPLCARHKLAAQVFASGQSVYPRLCHSGGPSQVAHVCPYYANCAHIDQYRGGEVFIYTHVLAPTEYFPPVPTEYFPGSRANLLEADCV
jgi:hypothetical protein